MSTAHPFDTSRTRRLSAMAIALSFAAGATDAFAFLQLGGIFTANMTGNLILVGLTQRPGYLTTLMLASIAIVVFAAAVYFSLRVARPEGPGRRGLVTVLTTAFVAQLAVFIGWILNPTAPTTIVLAALVALSAVAMGGQTAVSRRVQTRSGITTTFVTGTLTNLMASFADRDPNDRGIRTAVILALVAGALYGSLLVGVNPALGAASPLPPALVGLILLAITPVQVAKA